MLITKVYTVSDIKRAVIDIYRKKENVIDTILRDDNLYVIYDDCENSDDWCRIPLSEVHMKFMVFIIAENEHLQLKKYTFDRQSNLVTLYIEKEEE